MRYPAVCDTLRSGDRSGGKRLSEHAVKIAGGLVLVVIGVAVVSIEPSGLGALVLIFNIVGGIIALIGAIGAGVRAGNREVVEELRRINDSEPTTRGG